MQDDWTNEKRLELIQRIAEQYMRNPPHDLGARAMADMERVLYLAAASEQFLESNADKYQDIRKTGVR